MYSTLNCINIHNVPNVPIKKCRNEIDIKVYQEHNSCKDIYIYIIL